MAKINLLKYFIIYLIIPIVLSNNLNENNKSIFDTIKENKVISIIIGVVIIIIIIIIIYCFCKKKRSQYTIASDMGLIEDKEQMIAN